jgi:hypothetical protein
MKKVSLKSLGKKKVTAKKPVKKEMMGGKKQIPAFMKKGY